MSRWHRMNPEKGNQVEPSGSYTMVVVDAMRKGEIPMPSKHAFEAHYANEAHDFQRDPNCAACDKWAAQVAGEATLEANNKAYDRQARLAEKSEKMLSMVKAYSTIAGSCAVNAEMRGDRTVADIYHAARNEADDLIRFVEGDS